jgi:hypothetical protein
LVDPGISRFRAIQGVLTILPSGRIGKTTTADPLGALGDVIPVPREDRPDWVICSWRCGTRNWGWRRRIDSSRGNHYVLSQLLWRVGKEGRHLIRQFVLKPS